MIRTNLYEVVYDESKVSGLDKESPEYQAAIGEAQYVAHVVQATNLREALDKAEAQALKNFTVFDVKLIKSNINVL